MTDEISPERDVVSRSRARMVLDACADAIRFFTRLSPPAEWGSRAPEAISSGIAAAAPLAGLLIGAASGAVLALLLAVGLPATPAAVFATAAGVWLSGALHLDGLSDVADGFGGGKTLERKLEIMRDSRLGTYGAAALTLVLLARVTLVAALADRLGEAGAFAGLVACAALARPLALSPILLLSSARDDGVGRATTPTIRAVAIGCTLGAAFALLFAGFAGGSAAIALAAAAAAGLIALARWQIGGFTGDVCGATTEIAEIAALVALVAAAG